MRFKTLSSWLEWLESLRVVRSSETAFQQTKLIAKKLHLFPTHSKAITVTGTNGKGSCVALLEAIYHAAGYKIGAYTSPHLIQFNERIRINFQEVSDQKICEAFEKVDQARGEIELNYFQFATLAALLIFKEANLDLIILEVGIGGRLDAVNIVDPEVSVISTISLDHREVLGDTREEVAIEKAGIMRKGKPVICGDREPPNTLFAETKRIGAELYCLGKEFDFVEEGDSWQWRVGSIERHSDKNRNLGCLHDYDHLPIPTILLDNTSTVLMAVSVFQQEMPVSIEAIHQGLKQVKVLGRFQVEKKEGITLVFDVAHNPQAAANLAKRLEALPIKGKRFAIVGMMKDKDIEGTLKHFLHRLDAWFVTGLKTPRGADPKEITKLLKKMGEHQIQCYSSAQAAFHGAFQQAVQGDLIVVFGSFLTVGNLIKEVN